MPSQPIYVTRPLLSVLLELAADAEPNQANVQIVASAAGDLEGLPPEDSVATARSGRLADLDPATPIYSDFYFPDVGNALDFVFGVDLGTPAGQSHGRFLSHPDGNPDLSIRDDLHATVLVAVPPWRPENVAVYDRDSTRRDMEIVEAGTPDRDFEG